MYRSLLVMMVTASLSLPLKAQNDEAPLGTMLPDLPVTHIQGGTTNLHALAGSRGTVLVFWSNACSWTEQYEDRVLDAAKSATGVSVILINANDTSSFPLEAQTGKQYSVPYVRDTQADVARALGAMRTPHVFAFDAGRKLVYVGGIDDAPADPAAVRAAWLASVVSELSSGASVTSKSTKAFGCRIKLP